MIDCQGRHIHVAIYCQLGFSTEALHFNVKHHMALNELVACESTFGKRVYLKSHLKSVIT